MQGQVEMFWSMLFSGHCWKWGYTADTDSCASANQASSPTVPMLDREHCNWTMDQQKRVAWSDKSQFVIHHANGHVRISHLPGGCTLNIQQVLHRPVVAVLCFRECSLGSLWNPWLWLIRLLTLRSIWTSLQTSWTRTWHVSFQLKMECSNRTTQFVTMLELC